MRHFLLTDLEGPAGVDSWSQTRDADGTPAKEGAMRLLTAEVNAVIAGIRDADPKAAVTVWDGHGSGGLLPDLLDPAARYLPGRHPLLSALEAGSDALYFVGQHAMAGTPAAPLCHTYSSRHVVAYRLNGRPVGEFGCRAALAGELGIPTVFLGGDDKAGAEAVALIPDIVTVATKVGLGVEAAEHLEPAESCARLRRGAAAAAQAVGRIAPHRLTGPHVLEIELAPHASLAGHLGRGAEQTGPHQATYRAEHLRDLPL